MTIIFLGFTTALALIAAIGAQNAFVIRQGLMRQHVLLICLMFSLSDLFLIFIGVFGLAYINRYIPLLEPIVKYAGTLFLFFYGLKSFISAFKYQHTIDLSKLPQLSIKKTILLCLAFTWLNPHVYLDTVLLIGSIANNYPGHQLEFAIGATLASFFLFFSLGYGAALLRPLFIKPFAWKCLDVITGLIMWIIAVKLII